ncbi:hypothetical protein U9M48_028574 [Paspalum notatum var. saurae]|uniref:Integrase zinc-binding domain-containing protein n=1 Tax=Paspalum notatum var. saurae TaxID=547442 RepID=A0AAQ3X0Q4_PASNO
MRGVEFCTKLIIIGSAGIDIILGMETLAKWDVRIDCAKRTVHLTAPDGQKVEVSATEPSGCLHQMEAKPTEGIRVVCEYPDVFPEELPGYYRRFIESFSRIAKSMTSLLEKGVPFNWTKERQAAFDELKKRLTTALNELNMRRERWLELIKDYDLEIHYHPGKANVVADALSRKSYVNMAVAFQMPLELCAEFESLNLGFVHHTTVATFEAEPTLEQEIRNHQKMDEKIQEIREQIKLGKAPHFREDEQGTVWYKNRICVPDVDSIKKLILSEAHDTTYSIHPGSTKMYHDLKERFWWYGMKRAKANMLRPNIEARGFVATFEDPAVEMGGNKYGFHCGVTRDSKRLQLDPGSC